MFEVIVKCDRCGVLKKNVVDKTDGDYYISEAVMNLGYRERLIKSLKTRILVCQDCENKYQAMRDKLFGAVRIQLDAFLKGET